MEKHIKVKGSLKLYVYKTNSVSEKLENIGNSGLLNLDDLLLVTLMKILKMQWKWCLKITTSVLEI